MIKLHAINFMFVTSIGEILIWPVYDHILLNGQTLYLNKVIVGRKFAKNCRKMCYVQP